MSRRAAFFDIDGTLAVGTPGKQYIPESTKKAIKILKDNGIKIHFRPHGSAAGLAADMVAADCGGSVD